MHVVDDGGVALLVDELRAPGRRRHRSRILASGTAMPAALDAGRELAERFDVGAEVWSATSYKALRDDACSVERWNRLHPGEPPRAAYLHRVLDSGGGPVVAVTDHVKLVADQVGRFMPEPFISLGTDGFGLSDTRRALRRHFEVDTAHVVVAVLSGLFDQGELKAEVVLDAARLYGVDPNAPDPRGA